MKRIKTIKLLELTSIVILLLMPIFFIACTDDEEPVPVENNETEYSQMKINLTDAPGDYQQVNINVYQVRVQTNDSSWIDLTTNNGFYDLLELTNGIDTTIVQDSLTKGTYITQMRLVLGDSSNVMVDSSFYPLKVPSGSTSGFKINFSDSLRADSLVITLDFDAEKSIIQQGNKNDYLLKPVFKVK